jgi:hypothetical protein
MGRKNEHNLPIDKTHNGSIIPLSVLHKVHPNSLPHHTGVLKVSGKIVFLIKCAGIVNQVRSVGIDPRTPVWIEGRAWLTQLEWVNWHQEFRRKHRLAKALRKGKKEGEAPLPEYELLRMKYTENPLTWKDVTLTPFEEEMLTSLFSVSPEPKKMTTSPFADKYSFDPAKVQMIHDETEHPEGWPPNKKPTQVGWCDGVMVARIRSNGLTARCKRISIDPRVKEGETDEAWLTLGEWKSLNVHRNFERAPRHAPESLPPPEPVIPPTSQVPSGFLTKNQDLTDEELDRTFDDLKKRLVQRDRFRQAQKILNNSEVTDPEIRQALEGIMNEAKIQAYGSPS